MFHEVVAMAMEAKRSPEEISLRETEEKFASLALAFKTDRQTLDKRIELHLRARDIAEENIQKELTSLKEGVKVLSHLRGNKESTQQLFVKIQNHLDVLEQSISRMSSRAELHGAVQQELRVSQVMETMVNYVEKLKRTYETEHNELQEARRSITENRDESFDITGGRRGSERPSLGGTGKGSLRRISLALMAKNSNPFTRFRSISTATSPPFPLSSPLSPLLCNNLDESSDRKFKNTIQQQQQTRVNCSNSSNGNHTVATSSVQQRKTGKTTDIAAEILSPTLKNKVLVKSVDQKTDGDQRQMQTDENLGPRKMTVRKRFISCFLAVRLLLLLLLRQLSPPHHWKSYIYDGLSNLLGDVSSKCHLLSVPPAVLLCIVCLLSVLVVVAVVWMIQVVT